MKLYKHKTIYNIPQKDVTLFHNYRFTDTSDFYDNKSGCKVIKVVFLDDRNLTRSSRETKGLLPY